MSDPLTLFIEVGRRLFGEKWQTPLAKRCGRRPRTVRRWVAKEMPVPPDVIDSLPDIVLTASNECVSRSVELRHYYDKLRKDLEP